MSDDFGTTLDSLTPFHWLGVLLAAVTGAVHLWLYADTGFVLFLASGLGYLGGVGLLVVGVERRLLYQVGIGYVLIHIVGWIVAGMPGGGWSLVAGVVTLGTLTKLVEITLLGVLLSLHRDATLARGPNVAEQPSQ